MPLRFRPAPNEPLSLFGEQYFVQPFQQQPALAYAAEGKAAIVYKIKRRNGPLYALKVFKKQFRTSDLVGSSARLGALQSYEGLRAAQRQVVEDGEKAAQECPELLYAMLMPWISGTTWNDLLIKAGQRQPAYDQETGVQLCRRFLSVMDGLESSGIAHTDIAPGNVVVTTQPLDVQLLDLEDLFIPGFPPPATLPKATPGYDHPAAGGTTTWAPEGDRYAAAVLAAEMLLLPHAKIAATATDAGLFGGNRTTPQGKQRFPDAYSCLQSISPTFAEIFKQVWNAKAVKECPRISELQAALTSVVWLPQQQWTVTPTPAASFSSTSVGPVIWVPRPGSVFAPHGATPTASSEATHPGVSWTIAQSTASAASTATAAATPSAAPAPSRRNKAPWIIGGVLLILCVTALYLLLKR